MTSGKILFSNSEFFFQKILKEKKLIFLMCLIKKDLNVSTKMAVFEKNVVHVEYEEHEDQVAHMEYEDHGDRLLEAAFLGDLNEVEENFDQGVILSMFTDPESIEIRNEEGDIVGVPYLSNTDSLAYNKTKIGEDINTWEALFDSQFKGYSSIQNSLGPTFTITAIYLKQSNKQDIKNPSNMTKDEIKGVCEFLIKMKKRGQFKKIWESFNEGVELLANGEVLVSSCWEPMSISAQTKGTDIKYGVMKEGHLSWNNIWMFTKGGKKRGQQKNFNKLMDLYLSPWFGIRLLDKYGFTPQMTGIKKYINDLDNLDVVKKQVLTERLVDKQKRISIKGNSWQNLYPKEILTYEDWWQKFLAA